MQAPELSSQEQSRLEGSIFVTSVKFLCSKQFQLHDIIFQVGVFGLPHVTFLRGNLLSWVTVLPPWETVGVSSHN